MGNNVIYNSGNGRLANKLGFSGLVLTLMINGCALMPNVQAQNKNNFDKPNFYVNKIVEDVVEDDIEPSFEPFIINRGNIPSEYKDFINEIDRKALLDSYRKSPKRIYLNKNGLAKSSIDVSKPPTDDYVLVAVFNDALKTGYNFYGPGLMKGNDKSAGKGYIASGVHVDKAGYSVTAVSKNCLPLGALIGIEGTGFKLAGDVGGALNKRCKNGVVQFDVADASYKRALSSTEDGVKAYMYLPKEFLNNI